MPHRAILIPVMSWLGVERAREAVNSSFKGMRLDKDNGFFAMLWNESKLSLEKAITMIPDALSYIIEFLMHLQATLFWDQKKTQQHLHCKG